MAEERFTITLSLEQAEAVVDAANCILVAAEGNLTDLIGAFTPDAGSDTSAANRYRLAIALHAQEAAGMLRPQLDDAYKRNPKLQDLMHAFKMWQKHGMPED